MEVLTLEAPAGQAASPGPRDWESRALRRVQAGCAEFPSSTAGASI